MYVKVTFGTLTGAFHSNYNPHYIIQCATFDAPTHKTYRA